jgi:hypothetical protein
MALKTATVPNRHNVGWRNSKDFADTVKKLAADNALVVKGEEAKKRVVKIVDSFVAKLKREEKAEARKELCKKAGIVLRTFERWKAEGEQRAEIGESIYAKAEEMGYDITASSIRNLADAKRLNPGKTPEQIVKVAQRNIDGDRKESEAPRIPLDAREQLVLAINAFVQANASTDDLIKVLRNSPIQKDKLCTAFCKGTGE